VASAMRNPGASRVDGCIEGAHAGERLLACERHRRIELTEATPTA
jgi:hypothetical protein